jgi:PAS domain S-box-containing protein
MNIGKTKILIVEDDFALSRLIQIKLESSGIETHSIYTGHEALQFIPKHPEYFVLMDYKLSDMHSKKIIEELYAKDIKFPFVIMTGFGDQNLAVEMMKLGAYDYIVKEFHFTEQLPAILLKAIKLYTSSHQLEESQKIIAKNEERYRSIFNNIHDIYIVLSDDYKIEEISPSFYELFKISDEIINGKELSVLFVIIEEWEIFRNLLSEKNSVNNYEALIAINQEKLEKNCLIDAKMIFSEVDHKHQIIGTIRDITDYKRLENEMIANVIQAEEKERKAIADELHDELGPLLSTIKIYINILSGKDKDVQDKEELLSNISFIVNESIRSIRTIVNTLTPNILNDYGLEKAFISFINKLPKEPIKVEFISNLSQERFGQVLESTIYRSGIELINNGIKHSQTDSIKLTLEQKGENLWLKYSDNGVGFDFKEQLNPEISKGNGLMNIVNRVKTLHGKIQYKSVNKKGTFIDILFVLSNVFDV